MTVFDNLENYDIPEGFNLTFEQEEKLSQVVAEIIPELDKRKHSKLETRKYFRQCLRFSSNVIEDNAQKGKKFDIYKEGEEYKSLEGEYRWASDLLHPVLLDVLRVEKFKYGYVINLILADREARHKPEIKGFWHLSDGVIQFVQQYDFETIKAEIEKQPDIRQRLVYLHEKVAQLKATDLLASYEREDWLPDYLNKMDALIKLEEKRLELFPSSSAKPIHPTSSEQEEDKQGKLFLAVKKFCDEDHDIENTVSKMLFEGVSKETSIIDRTELDLSFNYVGLEFGRFIDVCNIYSIDIIKWIFDFVDIWYEHLKSSVDAAYTECQKSIKKSIRNKVLNGKAEEYEKKAIVFARFIVEKATIVVSGYKANIMYNHRYVDEVFYNTTKGTFEDFLYDRERMEGQFGGGSERDALFNPNVNIKAFQEDCLRCARFGLIEAGKEADTMSEDERLSDYRDSLRITIEFDISFYINLVRTHPDMERHIHHEAVTWAEITRYSMHSAILAAELWVAYNEDMSLFIDYAYFQKVSFEYIPQLLSEAVSEFTSDTGSFPIDEELNDLGERDADDWDNDVPEFDTTLLTDDFITEKDLGIRDVDESTDISIEKRDAVLREAEEALKQSAKLLNGSIEIITPRIREELESQATTAESTYESCHLCFYDSVKEEEKPIIYKYMHDHVGYKPGVEEFLYIKALIDLNFIKYPTFTIFAAEFPIYSDRNRNFSHYFGTMGKMKAELSDLHQQKVDTYIKEIKTLLGLSVLE